MIRVRGSRSKGFLLTFEALASLLVLLGALFLAVDLGQARHGSRISALAASMQAEDVAEFVAGAGGAARAGSGRLEAVAEELGACMRISDENGGQELFRSECFGKESGKERASAKYFELEGTEYHVALVELERKG
ncbi:Uncharacterised protein [Candidatus Burarchaeum australiense]|nr:Uncharacterised protein [Candidatus Burarchaeum australiense]